MNINYEKNDKYKNELLCKICKEKVGSKYDYLGVIILAFKMFFNIKSEIPSPNGIIYRTDIKLVEFT